MRFNWRQPLLPVAVPVGSKSFPRERLHPPKRSRKSRRPPHRPVAALPARPPHPPSLRRRKKRRRPDDDRAAKLLPRLRRVKGKTRKRLATRHLKTMRFQTSSQRLQDERRLAPSRPLRQQLNAVEANLPERKKKKALPTRTRRRLSHPLRFRRRSAKNPSHHPHLPRTMEASRPFRQSLLPAERMKRIPRQWSQFHRLLRLARAVASANQRRPLQRRLEKRQRLRPEAEPLGAKLPLLRTRRMRMLAKRPLDARVPRRRRLLRRQPERPSDNRNRKRKSW